MLKEYAICYNQDEATIKYQALSKLKNAVNVLYRMTLVEEIIPGLNKRKF